MTSSIGFKDSVSFLLAIQVTRLLTFASVGFISPLNPPAFAGRTSRQVYNLGAVFDSPSAEAVEMDFKLSQAGGYELRPKMAEIQGFAESGPSIKEAGQWCAEQPNQKHPLRRRSNRPDVIA